MTSKTTHSLKWVEHESAVKRFSGIVPNQEIHRHSMVILG